VSLFCDTSAVYLRETIETSLIIIAWNVANTVVSMAYFGGPKAEKEWLIY